MPYRIHNYPTIEPDNLEDEKRKAIKAVCGAKCTNGPKDAALLLKMLGLNPQASRRA